MAFEIPDVWAFVKHARGDRNLTDMANLRFASIAAGLFGEKSHDRVRSSDAGSCTRQVWGRLRGLTAPPDVDQQASKMDAGTLLGAWYAALFAVAYEAEFPNRRVKTEVDSAYGEAKTPGHLDILICEIILEVEDGVEREDLDPLHVLEFKTSMWPNAFSGPMDGHFMQATQYAEGQGCAGGSVCTALPAAQRARNSNAEPQFFAQDDFLVSEWAEKTRADHARLMAAEGTAMPDADAKEAWRCRTCLLFTCAKNENPRARASDPPRLMPREHVVDRTQIAP